MSTCQTWKSTFPHYLNNKHNLVAVTFKIYLKLWALQSAVHIKKWQSCVTNEKENLREKFEPCSLTSAHLANHSMEWELMSDCQFWKVAELSDSAPLILMLQRCGWRRFVKLFNHLAGSSDEKTCLCKFLNDTRMIKSQQQNIQQSNIKAAATQVRYS